MGEIYKMTKFNLDVEIKMTYKCSIEVEAGSLKQAIEAGKNGEYNPPFDTSITIGKKEFYDSDNWDWTQDSLTIQLIGV